MSLLRNHTLGALLALSSVACFAQMQPALKVGSNAPAIKVSRWIKGIGPAALEPGKVYVVEFWATWCPPCRVSIPHLTELARAYQDKATFIGVSVWERGSGKALEDKVSAFVRDMGGKMDYLVARDTANGTMAKTWMDAAGQDGIPAAFVIGGDGKIAWIGHPMDDAMVSAIDEALAKL
jgi:thiol-disulfide isomerase/thioredoxin